MRHTAKLRFGPSIDLLRRMQLAKMRFYPYLLETALTTYSTQPDDARKHITICKAEVLSINNRRRALISDAHTQLAMQPRAPTRLFNR